MSTKLVQLEDGVLVEVEGNGADGIEQVTGAPPTTAVARGIDQIHSLILTTCKPFVNTWRELSKEVHLTEAEVELGIGFEAEGNLYVVKSKGKGNFIVRMKFKP